MLDSVDALLEDLVKDLYSAEKQILKALPRMIKAANNPALVKGFTKHLRETEGQVQRLEKIAELMEIKPGGKHCAGMEGLLKEGSEVMEEEGSPEGLDAALICAAQKVEHYEISGYGTARVLALQLEEPQIVKLLEQTLAEEKATDEKLTEVSESAVLPALAAAGAESAEKE
jgi:ferritin-like metal-binding protein YciE